MHFPFDFVMFGLNLHVHFITDVLSTLIGMQFYYRSKVADNVSESKRVWILIGAIFGALIGSRMLAAMENPDMFLNPPSILYFYVNKTIIGGIAGGIIGIEIAKKLLFIKNRTGDRVVVPLMVAILIGRAGCFLTGVTDGTVGNVCNYFWCFDQGDGMSRHPTSLYEIFFLLILLPIFYFNIQRKRFLPGVYFRIFIILYFSFRFFIEFLKPAMPVFLNLSAIQIVCISFVLYYIFDIIKTWEIHKLKI